MIGGTMYQIVKTLIESGGFDLTDGPDVLPDMWQVVE